MNASATPGHPMPIRTRNVLLVGRRPAAAELLRAFSPDPADNPSGWVGWDWRNRGYDVHARFMGASGGGEDDPSEWPGITGGLLPVAIITFSRERPGWWWGVEAHHGRPASGGRSVPPAAPSAPYFAWSDGGFRPPALPAAEIVRRVRAACLGVDAVADTAGVGGWGRCGPIASLGMNYQAAHAAADGSRCLAAGHISVGRDIPAVVARAAVEKTLHAVIDCVEARLRAAEDADRPVIVPAR